jgi:polysaccharide pyruvyl transferase WcaK-like protein
LTNRGRKVVVHGRYANRNYGDLLMLDILSMHVRRQFGVAPICPWIHATDRIHVAAQPGRGIWDCLQADVAFFGGGGYLHGNSRRGVRRLHRYLWPAVIWQFRQVPYALIGVGVGPTLEGSAARRVARICEGADLIAVRDEESRSVLVEAAVSADRIEVTADLVLSLERANLPGWAVKQAAGLLEPAKPGLRRFGFHCPMGRSEQTLLLGIVQVLSDQFGRRSDVEVIWFQDGPGCDAYHATVAAECLPKARVIPFQRHWVTSALIGQMDAVFTTKLHVGITAWALGVPPCGLSLHPKTKRFYKQIQRVGFQDYLQGALPTDDLPSRCLARLGLRRQDGLLGTQRDRLKEWLRLFADAPDQFRNDVPGVRETLSLKARRNFSILDKTLSRVL